MMIRELIAIGLRGSISGSRFLFGEISYNLHIVFQGGEKLKSYFIEMLTDQPRRTAVLRNTVKNKRTVATCFGLANMAS